MNQCNVVAVFKCLVFNSTTFCPCSRLSHINALACMSLLCLTEGIKVNESILYGSLDLPYLSMCRKIRGLFSGLAGRAAMPVHTDLKGNSHPCGRFFLAQKVQGCVSNYVRHGIFNPKIMPESLK